MTEVARLTLGPRAPWESVLTRVSGAVAADTDVPVDRLLDAQIALDQLVAGARSAGVDALSASFAIDERGMRVKLGPLDAADTIVDGAQPPGFDGALGRLADDLRIESSGEGEYVVLAFDGS